MELFLVFIMATLFRAASGGGDTEDGGLRRTWGLGIALASARYECKFSDNLRPRAAVAATRAPGKYLLN